MFKAKNTEFGGIRVGDKVKVKCVQVPSDNVGEVLSVRPDGCAMGEMAFRVGLKSAECPEANGEWYPIYLNELEKVGVGSGK